MRYRKVINEDISASADGVSVAGSVNAVVAVNVNETRGRHHISSKQRVRVVQRNGRMEVHESTVETAGEDDDGRET